MNTGESGFCVGDRVQYHGNGGTGVVTHRLIGDTGTILKVGRESIAVQWDRNPHHSAGVYPQNIMHASSSPTPAVRGVVRDAGGGVFSVLVDRDTQNYPRPGEGTITTFHKTDPLLHTAEYWHQRFMEVSQELSIQKNCKNRAESKVDALRAQVDSLAELERSLYNPDTTTPQSLDLLIANLQRIRSKLTR